MSRYELQGFSDRLLEQTEKVAVRPPIAPAENIDILRAVWGINRYAKRCRDAASSCYTSNAHAFAGIWSRRKAEAYDLKSQALHYLVAEGRLAHAGYHQFDGGNYAEVLEGDGYRFHRPCEDPEGIDVEEIDGIEAKPKHSKEPRLLDCRHTLELYLLEKPPAEVYEWPARSRATGRQSSRWIDYDQDEFDDDDADDDYEY